MTAEDIASLIAELGDIAEALQQAEPEHKLDLYRSLRLRLTYFRRNTNGARHD